MTKINVKKKENYYLCETLGVIATMTAKDKAFSLAAVSGHFSEQQQRGTEFLTKAGEVLLDTAKQMSDAQFSMTEAAKKRFLNTLPSTLLDRHSVQQYVAQSHEESELLIERMRGMDDLARGCAWRLLELYMENMKPIDSEKA